MGLSDFLFSDPVTKLTKTNLDCLVRRSELVAANLANADTPNYKAVDLDFKRILENTVKADQVVRMANSGNMQQNGAALSGPTEMIYTTKTENMRMDGNTVNMEDELLKSAEIQMMYELALTFLKKRGGLVMEVVKNSRV